MYFSQAVRMLVHHFKSKGTADALLKAKDKLLEVHISQFGVRMFDDFCRHMLHALLSHVIFSPAVATSRS